MIVVPILLYWALALWGFASRRPILLYLFFASLPFGSLAVIPPGATAGLTIVPSTMTALLLIVKTLSKQAAFLTSVSAAFDQRRLGFLFAFWVVAAITTIFMPRLFAQYVLIIPVRGDLSGVSPLLPTKQNLSQLAYLTVSVMAVFAFSQLLKTPHMRQTALHGLVVGAAITVLTGGLDLASQYLPLEPLLSPFRTATYALLVDVEVLGSKRIVGLMPEASSFGSLCLSFLCLLYFVRRAIRNDRVRDAYLPPIVLLLIMFAWFSTSSATYLGLAAFLFVGLVEWIVRFLERRYSRLRRRHLALELWLVVLAIISFAIILLLKPSLLDSFFQIVDRMVLQKSSSASFEERNMWTAVSLEALFATYGLGVGIGSTRASNHLVAVFSNAGVIAACFYCAFVIRSLLRQATPNDEEGSVLISGVRYAFLPPFVVGLLIGTSPDFGEISAFEFGLLTAIGVGRLYARRPPQSVRGPLVVHQ